MLKDAPKRRLCVRFERGDSYYFVNAKNASASRTPSATPTGRASPHRIRNTYNVIRPLIQGKVSKSAQRTPSYQVLPSTTDQTRVSAAEIAEKAARYGYGKWGIGAGRRLAAQYAIGHGGEAFGMPYFDPNVGPYVQMKIPETGQPTSCRSGRDQVPGRRRQRGLLGARLRVQGVPLLGDRACCPRR
jgi:hypothetical protein